MFCFARGLFTARFQLGNDVQRQQSRPSVLIANPAGGSSTFARTRTKGHWLRKRELEGRFSSRASHAGQLFPLDSLSHGHAFLKASSARLFTGPSWANARRGTPARSGALKGSVSLRAAQPGDSWVVNIHHAFDLSQNETTRKLVCIVAGEAFVFVVFFFGSWF